MSGSVLVRRGTEVLRPDPARVITKLFLPGQELLTHGISRQDAVIHRVLAMTDEQVSVALADTLRRFADRHHDLRETFTEHFAVVEPRLSPATDPSPERRLLIGAYSTQEYAVEAAALFNPSIVAHPDQSGLRQGAVRFIMSVRGVGEGHISSIEFRTGVFGASDGVQIDLPGRHLVTGRAMPATMDRGLLRDALLEHGDAAVAEDILSLLPDHFDADQLDAVLAGFQRDPVQRGYTDPIVDRIRRIASCDYQVRFPTDSALSERVIYPACPAESQGMEDARFTRFLEDDGTVRYYATYTAFDGSSVTPHLLQTVDFETFHITPLIGPAAKNKGMALFPRRVAGAYLALSRWNRESIDIARSVDACSWGGTVTVQTPRQPWELIQLGNCGAPIETEDGWLVLTHGVGPMREYGIGATLLDLAEPTTVIGSLSEPLLTPTEDERNGYVPNVVYSCGALLHEQTVLSPYGCSDSAIRFAFVDLPELLDRLRVGGGNSSIAR